MDGIVEFVGMSLVAGPPVGHLHLPLQAGTTALYGENGVGKTQILNAVSKLLAGLGANPRPSWTDKPKSYSQPAPSSLIEVAYLRGGVHLRLPMTPESSRNPGDWRPEFIEEIEQVLKLSPSGNEELDSDQFLAERWRQMVAAVRAELPWRDATDDDAEYLLRNGHWLLVADSATTCLCDPSPTMGPLAERWSASNELWAAHLRQSTGEHDENLTHEIGSESVVWYPGTNEWSIPSWQSTSSRGREQPCLPPTPDALGLPEWPQWAAFPIVLGPRPSDPNWPGTTIVTRPVLESEESAVEHTLRRISSLRPRPDGTWEPTDALNRIVSDANEILAAMFERRLLLSARVNTVQHLFRGEPAVQWFASVDGRTPIALERLGAAHSRFASFAIQQATSKTFRAEPPKHPLPGFRPQRWLSAAVIDEPERALHQAAIGAVAQGLSALAEYVVVASHAPEVLSCAGSRFLVTVDQFGLVRVERPTIAVSTASLKEQAVKLCMAPDKLVSTADVILLVEGQHDVEVLTEFLAPEVQRHILLLLAMGGTDGLSSIAEAAYLFASSSAPIIVCLDSLDTSVSADLTQIKQLPRQDERRQVLATLRSTPRYKKHPEMRALLELITSATEHDRLDRLHVHAFTKPDIVRYIDVNLMSTRPGSWEELEAQFLQARGQTEWRRGDGQPFKDWVGFKYRIPGIRRAVHDQVALWGGESGTRTFRHPDFNELGALIDRLHS